MLGVGSRVRLFTANMRGQQRFHNKIGQIVGLAYSYQAESNATHYRWTVYVWRVLVEGCEIGVNGDLLTPVFGAASCT